MNRCRNCGSKKLVSSEIDDRLMYYCSNCNLVEYEKRKYSSGYHSIIDDITESVAVDGTKKIDWVILYNTVFKRENGLPLPEFQLINWAGRNHLTYDFTENGDVVIFSRSETLKMTKKHKNEIYSECISVRGIKELVTISAVERKNDFAYLAFIGNNKIPYPVFYSPKSLSDTYNWGYDIYKEWLLSSPNSLSKILKKAGY